VIVMKFGGTSVDGPQRLRGVAAILAARRTERPVAVTSAMAGVTNQLQRLTETALAGDRAAMEEEADRLGRRHRETAQAIAPGDAALVERIEAHLRDLRVLLRGVRLLGTATPRSSDQVLGYGELLAQELLAAALQVGGAPGVVVDSREVVITDDRFGAARPQLAETRGRAAERVVPLVEAGEIPVLGGYLGATAEGIPTTLGRGGSDLSASVLGLALDAAAVEIWTDVDGLMTADPRLVPAAQVLEQATFREAAELAGFGAKVLHPASIDPAIHGGLPVVVRNSLAPERPGTRIGATGSTAPAVRAVASRGPLQLVALRAPGRLREGGFTAEVLRAVDRPGLQPLAVLPGPVWLELLLPADPALAPAIDALERFGEVRCTPGLALVAVVGEGLAQAPGQWMRVLAAAGEAPLLRLIQGPQGASLGLLTDEGCGHELVRTLHRALFETPQPEEAA
jgi:aspartate kinase